MKVDIDQHRQKMGMVFQHFNLFPHMTIMDNMTLAPVQVKHMDKAEAEKKAEEKKKTQDSQKKEEEKKKAQETEKEETKKEKVSITIKGGEVCREIAQDLQEKGLVKDAEDFRKYMQDHNYARYIRVGTFTLEKGMNYSEIAKVLTKK